MSEHWSIQSNENLLGLLLFSLWFPGPSPFSFPPFQPTGLSPSPWIASHSNLHLTFCSCTQNDVMAVLLAWAVSAKKHLQTVVQGKGLPLSGLRMYELNGNSEMLR